MVSAVAMGRAVCVGACLWAALAGCSTRQANRSGEGAQPSASIVPASPFEPRTLQIYPLTHLTRDAAGLGMIVLHVEIKDAWGDSVKWPGVLAVMLMGPGGQRTAPWRIDLSDPEKNSGAFDPVTRTYRIQLGGLPDWLEGALGTPGQPDVRVHAVFTLRGSDARQRFIQDEYVIQGSGEPAG